jgi:hypothetical protein
MSGADFFWNGVLTFCVFAALCLGCDRKSSRQEARSPMAKETTVMQESSAPDPERLVGQWVRPDGGYVLRITRVATDGVVDASYHNPSTINVESARVTTEDGKLNLNVKLNDTGYPGCVYELVYDPERDVMVGTYFQAAARQTFTIGFQRVK